MKINAISLNEQIIKHIEGWQSQHAEELESASLQRDQVTLFIKQRESTQVQAIALIDGFLKRIQANPDTHPVFLVSELPDEHQYILLSALSTLLDVPPENLESIAPSEITRALSDFEKYTRAILILTRSFDSYLQILKTYYVNKFLVNQQSISKLATILKSLILHILQCETCLERRVCQNLSSYHTLIYYTLVSEIFEKNAETIQNEVERAMLYAIPGARYVVNNRQVALSSFVPAISDLLDYITRVEMHRMLARIVRAVMGGDSLNEAIDKEVESFVTATVELNRKGYEEVKKHKEDADRNLESLEKSDAGKYVRDEDAKAKNHYLAMSKVISIASKNNNQNLKQ